MSKCKEQFIEFAKGEGFVVTTNSHGFLYPATHNAWKVWQAAWEASRNDNH